MTSALVFNSGSSSLKFGLYRGDGVSLKRWLHGVADIGSTPGSQGPAQLKIMTGDGREIVERVDVREQCELLPAVVALLENTQAERPDIIGHRIVHGGPHVRDHCLIDDRVMACLQAAASYAPLHNASSLAIVSRVAELWPGIMQAACLDTVFHAHLPEVAKVLPLNRELQLEGVERYGFHGLSCESVIARLGNALPQRLVIAHLGNGASITAVKNGRSVDTSMGLTPAGGIPMSTRSGDIDPGVLIYLLREKRYDAERLEEMLTRRSGLLGISRLSGDMRTLRQAAEKDEAAALAIEIFSYGVRKQVAAMAAVLLGIDLVVFTGGIGENDGRLRDEVRAGLSWAGLSQDKVKVVATQEEEQVARHALQLWGTQD
ncbi:MAG TPA: acetate kinase [Methylophilaceae bacterium]|nr:acetate kinase [Methylophilaceae bacterium]